MAVLRPSASAGGVVQPTREREKTSIALHNLRGLAIAFVLMVHASLAYVASAHRQPFPFTLPPYGWVAFPILDPHRWLGFDLFCAWQDVYLMSLLFFLSGAFTWPSIERDGGLRFVWKRVLRLGAPLIFGVTLLMPVALFPVYRVTAVEPNLAAYARDYLALPFIPCGPLWFLWVLLAFTLAAVALRRFARPMVLGVGDLSRRFDGRPIRTFAVWALVCVVAYAPLALLFTPWRWSDAGPAAVQLCRPPPLCRLLLRGIGRGNRRAGRRIAPHGRRRGEKMGDLDGRRRHIPCALDGTDGAGPPSGPVGASASERRKRRELCAGGSVQRGVRPGVLPALRIRRPLAVAREDFR